MAIAAVTERTPDLLCTLLALWEQSVRATHHFLTEDDITALVPQVENGLLHVPILCTIDAADNIAGFMGIDGRKVEMLFIRPDRRGQGLGALLLRHAIERYRVDSLDVNEQNDQGVVFYTHMGFTVSSRSDVDSSGMPFPILHMELVQP